MHRPASASTGKAPFPWRSITLRLLAALPGGYSLSAMAGLCIALTLPLSRADTAMAGTLLGLTLWPFAFMTAFGIQNLKHLLTGMTLSISLLTLTALAAGWHP